MKLALAINTWQTHKHVTMLWVLSHHFAFDIIYKQQIEICGGQWSVIVYICDLSNFSCANNVFFSYETGNWCYMAEAQWTEESIILYLYTLFTCCPQETWNYTWHKST